MKMMINVFGVSDMVVLVALLLNILCLVSSCRFLRSLPFIYSLLINRLLMNKEMIGEREGVRMFFAIS